MDPYSRGKRILDLSLEMQRQDIEEKKLKPSYCSQSLEKEPSVLDISTTQLVNLSDEVDLSISDADMSSFNDFPSIISSSMKVANYIMHHCTDTVTDNTHIIQGNTDGFFKDKDYTELTEVVHDRNYLSETDSTESYYKNIEDQIEIVQNEPTFITDVAEVQPISVAHDERRESTTIEDSQTSANATNIEGDTVFSEKATGAAKANNKRKEEKQKRQHGESYKGRHFDKQSKQYVEVEKEEQKLGPRCSCKASYYLCKEVTDEVREKIHKEIWKMSWDEKKVFVRESVCVREVKERKVVSESYKRNNTMIFSLKGNGERKRVCKEMFLNTTGLKKWWALNTLTDVRDDTCKPLLVQDSDGLKFIKEFIGRLPKMPSHYCRKDTSKLYLEPMFQSYSDIYHEYIKICESESKPKMSRTSFVAQIKAMNISIFQPRKDQCDTCCEFSQGNSDEALYIKHRERKEAAQNEKSKDKEAYPLNSRTKLLCVDVQRVLLAPSLKASTLYYKTKLQVHNYTIYDMVSKDVVCFVWNEAEGGLSANEFASCLVAYLEENVNSFDKVIIYSDGCTYQNRNRVLATALRYFCVKHTKKRGAKNLGAWTYSDGGR